MEMHAVEQPEKDAYDELDDHGQADIGNRFCAIDLEDLRHKAEHSQEPCCEPDHLPFDLHHP